MYRLKYKMMRFVASVKNITFKRVLKFLTIMTVLFIWTEKIYTFSQKEPGDPYPSKQARDTPNSHTVEKLTYNVQDSLKAPESKPANSSERLRLFYSQYINGVKASAQNKYITQPNYVSRDSPQYFNDPTTSLYQLTTYYSAGELARRYHARYIVDLGCGAGTKLAAFHKEFHLIGIDFKSNLDTVRQNHPYIDLIEVDLDQAAACKVRIPPGVLSQAVVVSADVIEHLVDPLGCYVKLLQELASRVLAVVISTPDRVKLNAVFSPASVQGPPYNPSHVREWVVDELEVMLLDHGMFPAALGWECLEGGKCGAGFTPESNPHTTAVLMVPNTQVRSMWLEVPPSSPGVYAYVTVQPETNEQLLDYNLLYLKQQGIPVCLVAVGSWEDKQNRKLPLLKAGSMEDAGQLIASSVNSGTFKQDDWILVVAAHEIVSFPQYSVWNLSLHDTLIRIGREPYGFNAVAMSIFFMQDQNGQPHVGVPFKMFGLHPWSTGGPESLTYMRAPRDTLQQRVRIWKRGDTRFQVSLSLSDTVNKQFVISDVDIVGRKVYPFHAQSLRFHPSSSTPAVHLSPGILKMYVLETVVGYYEENRGAVYTNKYLY